MTKIQRRLFYGIALFTTLVVIGALIYLFMKSDFVPPIEHKVERGSLEISIVATGDVKPENRLEIKPPLAGRIDQVLVKEGQQVKSGEVLVLMSSNERAALLDAARAKGEEEVRHWESLYRPIPIVAPLAGTIIFRDVEAGQTFDAGKTILALSDRLLIKAQVDETDLSRIKLNQKARVVLDAYPKEPLMGHVHKISYESKVVNNVTTYTIDVLTDHVPDFMRSGMTANVSFILDSRENVLLVPNGAIETDGMISFVTRKNSQGKPERVSLESGLTDGKFTEVLSGPQEGDIILIPQMSFEKSTKQNNGLLGTGGRPSRRR